MGFIASSICRDAADGPESETWQCSTVMICPGLNRSTIQTSTLILKITRLIALRFFAGCLIVLALAFTINAYAVYGHFFAFCRGAGRLNKHIQRIGVHGIVQLQLVDD